MQVGKGIGLCTPCAGHRPGAADPQRSKAAIPPPRRKQCSQVVLKDFGGFLDPSWYAKIIKNRLTRKLEESFNAFFFFVIEIGSQVGIKLGSFF